jgi:hypothetical protein
MVVFEEVGQGLALLERDEGQEDVAGERQVERGGGLAVAVAVFLPGAGVAFVVVAVLHRPMSAHGAEGAGLFVRAEAGEEVAGVAVLLLERVFLLRPIALDGDRAAGAGQPGGDGADGGDGSAPPVQAPVVAFLAQLKKGVPWRACFAPASRWAVLALVPRR